MLNFMYANDKNLVIAGCGELYESELIAVKGCREMITLSPAKDESSERVDLYFKGVFDPGFKAFILGYLKDKGVNGIQLCNIENVFYEMSTDTDIKVGKAVQEMLAETLDDSSDFRLSII
ncbi:MAG: hypothetical protein IJ784_13680 [Ruminiclostridium sp.]|nr:hypothetical protein [Ruminiclostridium sp.]